MPCRTKGDVKAYIASSGGADIVLLSHCHVDHIIGLNALKKDYPDAKVYIHRLDRDGLYDTFVNYSFERIISEPFVFDFDVMPLDEGSYDLANSNVPALFESLMCLRHADVPGDTAIFFGHGERLSYSDMLALDCFSKPLTLSIKDSNGKSSTLNDSWIDGGTLMIPLQGIASFLGMSCFTDNDGNSTAYLPDMSRLTVKAGSNDA